MRLSVTVKPGSKKGPLLVAAESGYLAYLQERPIDGQANEALEKLLAEHFAVAKSKVQVVRGFKSKNKIVEIQVAPETNLSR